jgi:hypothetical protein
MNGTRVLLSGEFWVWSPPAVEVDWRGQLLIWGGGRAMEQPPFTYFFVVKFFSLIIIKHLGVCANLRFCTEGSSWSRWSEISHWRILAISPPIQERWEHWYIQIVILLQYGGGRQLILVSPYQLGRDGDGGHIFRTLIFLISEPVIIAAGL